MGTNVYADAYLEMKYQCDDCGEAIFIWNGRDGCAPELIICVMDGCLGFMEHVVAEDIRTDTPFRAKWEFFGAVTRPDVRLNAKPDVKEKPQPPRADVWEKWIDK